VENNPMQPISQQPLSQQPLSIQKQIINEIPHSKNRLKLTLLTLIIFLVVIASIFLVWKYFLQKAPNYTCKADTDCVKTCRGCKSIKDRSPDFTSCTEPLINCKCINSQCVGQQITPTPDPTADWKIYENDQYGFSFNYPSEFSIEDGKIVLNS
jgi:hypothetical protein